jgi:hypothetical protein
MGPVHGLRGHSKMWDAHGFHRGCPKAASSAHQIAYLPHFHRVFLTDTLGSELQYISPHNAPMYDRSPI